MTFALIEGARLARVHSTGDRVIDIVVTEIGLIVRGRGTAGGLRSLTHSCEVAWCDFDANKPLLFEAVRRIARVLEGEA